MSGGQERRQGRDFEPPPWEQEAFERFQKKRQEREKEEELDEALARLRSARLTSEGAVAPADDRQAESGAGDVAEAGSTAPVREYEIPAAQLEELMAGLREEEPKTNVQYHGIANTVTVLLVIGGIGFVVWAGILLGKAGAGAGSLQMMASLLVMLWGFMMIAFGVVLWRKYNL